MKNHEEIVTFKITNIHSVSAEINENKYELFMILRV